MTADSLLVMDGPFYFNHNLFDMMRIDYRIPLNSVEVWTLRDSTMVAHPFHIHNVHFYILDRNGAAPSAVESGPKDVVLVQPNETVRFIAKFEDFADTTVPYMFHCHILMHEDDGMMGQFVVTPSTTGIDDIKHIIGVHIYPNPARDEINIQMPVSSVQERSVVKVTDVLGRQTFCGTIQGHLIINTRQWQSGCYNILITNGYATIRKQFIID